MKTKAIIDEAKKIIEIHGQMNEGELFFLRYHFEVNDLEICRDTGKKEANE